MALTQQKSGTWINTPSHLLILTLCPCVLRRSAMLHEDFPLSGTFGWNEAFVFRAPVIFQRQTVKLRGVWSLCSVGCFMLLRDLLDICMGGAPIPIFFENWKTCFCRFIDNWYLYCVRILSSSFQYNNIHEANCIVLWRLVCQQTRGELDTTPLQLGVWGTANCAMTTRPWHDSPSYLIIFDCFYVGILVSWFKKTK